MIKRVKGWENRANKKRTRGSDAEKLDELQTHLTALGFHILREPQLWSGNFSTRNHKRNPDLKVQYNKFGCYIELDGKIHGNLEQPTERTLRRNTDYEIDKLHYMIISEEDAKFFKLDLCDLTAYMVLHEYSKHLAKMNGGLMFN